MKHICYLLLFILSCSFVLEKNTDDKKSNHDKLYTVDELKADFSFMRRKLEKRDPNLYLYTSKNRIDNVFDSLYNSITSPMTSLEFYKLLSELRCEIRDGHTHANLNRESLKSFFNKDSLFLPYLFYFSGNKLYTGRRFIPDTLISDGTEIIRVNGLSSQEIVNRLLKYTTHDGRNVTGSIYDLNSNFIDFYNVFIGRYSLYEITYVGADSTEKTATIKAQPLDTIRRYSKLYYYTSKSKANPWKAIDLKIDTAQHTAILKIRTFESKFPGKRFHRHFRHELRKVLSSIQKNDIQHLILDVRGNGGGFSGSSKYLLKHLIDHRFSVTERCYRVNRKKYADVQHRNRPQRFIDIGIGLLRPASCVFSGDVFVLIDGGCFSATSLVSACLRYYHRAVFIGEETGGCEYAQGGYFMKSSFKLPHTGIVFSMTNSMSVGKTDLPNTELGVKPDYLVPLTINDILKKKDPVMDFAKDLIASGKK